MKLKSGFMLREIAGNWVVIPLGARVIEFNGIMTLSESGALLWRLLEQGSNENGLVDALLSEYAVKEEVARRDVTRFLSAVASRNLFEDERKEA